MTRYIWQQGTKINWSAFYAEEKRRHIPLPTYSFQREKYWIEPDENNTSPMKPEKSKIPKCYAAQEESQKTKNYATPRNKIEKKLIVLYQDMLGLKNIGINDNFFDLGGDSLKALRLIEKISELFNCKLVLLDIHIAETISELAHRILKKCSMIKGQKMKE